MSAVPRLAGPARDATVDLIAKLAPTGISDPDIAARLRYSVSPREVAALRREYGIPAGADVTADGLPHPSPTRLNLAHRIKAGEVRHYFWTTPVTWWRSDDGMNERKVTADVAVFVRAELADYGPEKPGDYGVVTLTDAGRAWLERGKP